MSTLRQFAYWLAVVEEESFTRAARKMHVAQPSLSQQIRALEAELGGDLLERLPRSVRLTPAGRAFLPHARIAVRSAERAARAARAAMELEEGELEISTVRSLAVGALPTLLCAWHEIRPGAIVRLHEFTHRRLAEDSVRDGLSDLGIGPPPRDWTGPVCTVGFDELVVVLPPGDPLGEGERVQLRDLAERHWVMFTRDNGMYDLMNAVCATARFQPEPAVETAQVEAAARLAAAGMGPALVPRNIVPDGLEAHVLGLDPPAGREITVYGRSDWAPLDRAFVELMQRSPWPQAPERALVVN